MAWDSQSHLAMNLLSVKNFAHLCVAIWLGCIIAFLGYSFFVLPKAGSFSQSEGTILIFIIITGVVAFLAALILYSTHILFLRKKPVHGHSRGSRVLFFLPIMGLLVAVFLFALFGAYRLGVSNNQIPQTDKTVEMPTSAPTEAVKYINSQPVISEQPTTNNSNTQQNSQYVPCTVYGQTFNLTPETCRYYQGQEAGAKSVNNDGYVPPYHNYETNTTPVPTTPPEQYQSNQSACERKCTDLYKYYPDTSKARQECYASCGN